MCILGKMYQKKALDNQLLGFDKPVGLSSEMLLKK